MDSEAFKFRELFSDLSRTIQYHSMQIFKNVTDVVLLSAVHTVAMFAVLSSTWKVARWIALLCSVRRTDTQVALHYSPEHGPYKLKSR
jgi:hypothetical protein